MEVVVVVIVILVVVVLIVVVVARVFMLCSVGVMRYQKKQ